MVKKIGVALSSSVDEFRTERLELGNFIRFLNENIYSRRGIHLDWRVCEDESGAVTRQRRQEVFNAKIRQSRFFFLLVGRRIGPYTREEFDIALKLFNAGADGEIPEERGAPKIFPFFKEMPDAEREESALSFRKFVENEVNKGQYSLKFSHIDTLKFHMLREFGMDAALWGKVTVEDEQARIDGQPVMSVENIPAYANHRKLSALRRRRARLDADFAELSIRYHAGDRDAGEDRLLVSEERNKLSKEIHAIEQAVLDALTLVAELARERQTERAEAAAKLLEAGEYEKALAALQSVGSPEIESDWAQAEQMAAVWRERLRALIRENRLRIQTLRTRGINKETLSEMEACHKKSANAAQANRMEPQAVYDYAYFLWEQSDYLRAIELCEWLEAHYEGTRANAEMRAQLWNLLGGCHLGNQNLQKSEEYYRKALEYYRDLSKTNSIFSPYLATIHNNLALVLARSRRYKEAKDFFRKALDMRRALAETNPVAFSGDVASSCNGLAIALSEEEQYGEAETLYREALKRYRDLAEAYPGLYIPDVAMACNNLANLLYATNRYAEAEKLYQEAQSRYRNLAEANPAAFQQYVAATCNNLASLLKDTGRWKQAELFYGEALEHYQTLSKSNFNAVAQHMASVCFNLGLLEHDFKHNPAAAKPLFLKALFTYAQFPHLAHMAQMVRQVLETNF